MSKSDGADCGEEDSFDNCCCCNDPGLGKCAGVLIGEIVSGKDFFNEIKKRKKEEKTLAPASNNSRNWKCGNEWKVKICDEKKTQ